MLGRKVGVMFEWLKQLLLFVGN